jgi:hypothetical protein
MSSDTCPGCFLLPRPMTRRPALMGRSAARGISTGVTSRGTPGRARPVSHPISQTPSGLVLAGTHRITDSAIFVNSLVSSSQLPTVTPREPPCGLCQRAVRRESSARLTRVRESKEFSSLFRGL